MFGDTKSSNIVELDCVEESDNIGLHDRVQQTIGLDYLEKSLVYAVNKCQFLMSKERIRYMQRAMFSGAALG